MILPVSYIASVHNTQNNSSRINTGFRCKFGVQTKPIVDSVSFKSQTSIFKFSQVDETLYRGSRPEPNQMNELKDVGISTIIDFTTERFRQAGYSEAEQAENLGIKHVKIPLVGCENPSEADVEKFFDIIDEAKANNKKVYVHCLEGRDRTGLFVELYKIRGGISDAQTSINTLIKNRYNFSENPLAINFIKQFAETVKTRI